MMYYEAVFELFQKLHLLIYASQFMKSWIIPLSFVLLNLERMERKGKNYKNVNIFESEYSFLDEIKTIFHNFWRVIIW